MLHFDSLHRELDNLVCKSDRTIEFFAPYISRAALEEVLKKKQDQTRVAIVTTWKIADVAFGASDLSIYPYCKENGIYLFLNQRLHLKSYLADYKKLLAGSANITKRALGLSANSNYETLVQVDNPPQQYLIFLSKIRKEATLVTDEIADQFQKSYEKYRADTLDHRNLVEEAQLIFDNSLDLRKAFLISALPMSRSIKDLYDILRGVKDFDDEVLASAQHDIANYELESFVSETYEEFRKHLTSRFFQHPFIASLCQFIDGPKRFGAIKEWVQSTCTSVPVPSRRDLTGNVQVLYEWLKDLGEERYEVTRPNYSEIISPKPRGSQ